jgi:hypothetical protein
MNPLYAYHLAVLALTGLVAWKLHEKRSPATLLAALAVILLGIFGYSNHGLGHNVQDPSRSYRGNYHFSELWHYYLGSKYARELGPYRIYEATAAAKKEAGVPQADGRVRDQRHPMRMISIEEAIQKFDQDGRSRFSPERWEAYKADVLGLWKASGQKYWPMHDMGYNPPPSYSFMVGAVSSILPPSAFTLELMAAIDWMLALACLILLVRTFGVSSGFLFAMVYLTNPLSNWMWVGGAYFRNIELFCLCAALCALQTKRFWATGAALGLATSSRLFPLVFLAGALLPLWKIWLYQPNFKNTLKPLQLVGGFAAVTVLILGGSLIQQGPQNWRESLEKISNHGNIFFAYHIGAKKLVTQTDADPNQWFDRTNPQGELEAFDEWNAFQRQKLQDRWNNWWWLSLGLWAAAALVCCRERPRTSMVLLGETTLFLFTLPANYYYILLAAFTANAAANPEKPGHTWRIGIPLTAVVALNLTWAYSSDPIVLNHYHNVILALMIGSYVLMTFLAQMHERGWFTPPEKLEVVSRHRRVSLLSVLIPLVFLGAFTWKAPQSPETRTWFILNHENLQISKGTKWTQFLPNFNNRVCKTQITAASDAEGKILLTGSIPSVKDQDAELVFEFTTAPDYVDETSLRIGGDTITLQSKTPNVAAEKMTVKVHLKTGENPLEISGQGKPGELMGINAILIKSPL